MALQTNDSSDQVHKNGNSEFLNKFLRNRDNWIYGRLHVGCKIKRQVKNGSERFDLSN